jgi:hypothetical protein
VKVTHEVDVDEKAFALAEVPLTPLEASKAGRCFVPDSYEGLRRYEFVWVRRDGEIAMHMRDMGDASLIAAPPVRVIGNWEESVGTLREWAATWRLKDAESTAELIQGLQAESTLVQDIIDYTEWRLTNARKHLRRRYVGKIR